MLRKLGSPWRWLPMFPVFIFLALGALQIHRPPIEDEVEFYKAALLWSEKGPQLLGLWHTPLYLDLLRLWQRTLAGFGIQGSQIAILRSFGLLCGLFTAAVFIWGWAGLRRKSTDPVGGSKAGRGIDVQALQSLTVLLGLLLLHPYFLQSTLLLEIDTTLLVPLLLLWVIGLERWLASAASWKWTLGLAALLALALWAKELTPLVCFPAWLAWAALGPAKGAPEMRPLKKGSRTRGGFGRFGLRGRLVFRAALGCGIAGLIFFLILWSWTRAHGFSLGDPFKLTLEKAGDRGHGWPWEYWGLGRWLFLSYVPLLWLFPAAIFVLRRGWIRGCLASPALALAVVIFLVYWFIVQASYYFPKYTSIVWPLLLWAWIKGETRVLEQDVEARKKARSWSGVDAMGMLTVALLIVGRASVGGLSSLDPLEIIDARREFSLRIALGHGFAVLIPVALLWVFSRGMRFRGPLTNGTLTGTSHWALLIYLLAVSVYHALPIDKTRGYLYGEEGFLATRARVQDLGASFGQRGASPAVWVLARDLALSMGPLAKFVEPTEILNRLAPSPALDSLESPWMPQVIVSRTYGEYSVRYRTELLSRVEQSFPCHAQIPPSNPRFEWWWQGPCASHFLRSK